MDETVFKNYNLHTVRVSNINVYEHRYSSVEQLQTPQYLLFLFIFSVKKN